MYLGYTNGLLFHCFMYTCSVPIINTIEFICMKRRRREEGRKENTREEKGGKRVTLNRKRLAYTTQSSIS